MKLKKSPNKKSIIMISIIAVALVAAAIVGIVITSAVIENGKQVKSIYVYQHPSKLQYYVTSKENYTGLKVGVTLNNGETFYVDAEDCEISGFDSSKPVESQFITVKYGGKSCGFYIKINPQPVVKPTLSKIEVTTLPKTEYKVGEWLDTTGGVITLYYNDGSTYKVSLLNRFVYGFNSSAANDALILTVKYTENGVTVSTTYTVKVVD